MQENKILNFGSLNIDLVYSLDHIVRPGETTSAYCVNSFCGGKGLNQSVALAKAGSRVFHAGKIGADGDILIDGLLSNNVSCDYIVKTDGMCGHALIQVEKSGQNSILLFKGTNDEIDKQMIDKILIDFSNGDILVCQNEISNVNYLIDKAFEKGMKIALNPSPIDNEILKCNLNHVEWIVINEIEGMEFTGEQDCSKIVQNLLSRYPYLKIVLTTGKDGVLYADNCQQYTYGIFDVEVVDTTAAGDTFLGYFICMINLGKGVEAALEYASAASSIAVSKKGAMPSIPSVKEVEEFLELHHNTNLILCSKAKLQKYSIDFKSRQYH